ncbi:MAG: hypothetical protein H6573_02285 [Lewinellaceae bacterium]|nr:hypothetical protein [Phaeodactylibacter sp.]MCB9346324.1 hypothetical protein [Lewinellaceae bacterium]
MFRKAPLLLVALMSLPLISQAHDGHGFFHGSELAHYLSSPGHAVPLVLVVAASVALILYRKRSREERDV